jgi:lipoate-protein ligase A
MRWRLLVDRRPATGWWNMAVDEVLLATAAAGGPPALRLYRWRGPWLSLGYAQPFAPERLAACARAGVGVVRRATGGLAVLHGADLTYAVAVPARLLPPGLEASYRSISDALLEALAAIGVEATRAARGGPVPDAFDCFGAPAAEELCADGRKLVGSAQRRTGPRAGDGGAVLQHGSIRLAPDPPAAARAAGLGAGATSLAELGAGAGRRLEQALADAFARHAGAALVPASLSSAERCTALRRAFALRREPLARRGSDTAIASRGL